MLTIPQVVGWQPCLAPKVVPPHRSSFKRFEDQFIKLALFNLTQFSRVLYLDADCLVLRQLDLLFRIP